jgi:hypothetical protein
MVRTKREGWLQGFITYTTFTTWHKDFEWNSLVKEAGISDDDKRLSPRCPLPSLPPPLPLSLPLAPRPSPARDRLWTRVKGQGRAGTAAGSGLGFRGQGCARMRHALAVRFVVDMVLVWVGWADISKDAAPGTGRAVGGFLEAVCGRL